jgi:hypothetical protein
MLSRSDGIFAAGAAGVGRADVSAGPDRLA